MGGAIRQHWRSCLRSITSAMDDAYQAGDYDLARSLIDERKDKQVEKGEDSVPRIHTGSAAF